MRKRLCGIILGAIILLTTCALEDDRMKDLRIHVSLNKTSLFLIAGESEALVATMANMTAQNVRWNSTNEAVATVSEGGLVSAIAEGSAVIMVSTIGGGIKATCIVTVIPPEIGRAHV